MKSINGTPYIYTDVGNDVLVFSKEPFPVAPAAESSPEDQAEAQAVAQEKAGEQAGGKRTRRSKKQGADAGAASNDEERGGSVAELKKATQNLLDATERAREEGNTSTKAPPMKILENKLLIGYFARE